MIELKTYKMVDEKYCTDCVCVIPSEVYLKKDADKVIARHKYKRCLAMARWCETELEKLDYKEAIDYTNKDVWRIATSYFTIWHKRWLELAEKFKEAK